jgi:hypothetical protein
VVTTAGLNGGKYLLILVSAGVLYRQESLSLAVITLEEKQ